MAAPRLKGFKRTAFTHRGTTRPVYVGGSGRAVIVIHEVPGLHPRVVDFGQRCVDAGFTVYMPSLLGTPGKPVSNLYGFQSMARACISREFTTFATNKTSPIVVWLRALARKAHEDCGGPGVGVVGMCLTGGFALAMLADAPVVAPVLSQPSLPLPFSASRRRAPGLSDADLAAASARCAAEDIPVLALRFTSDPFVSGDRFAALREALGDRFLAVEIPSPDEPNNIPKSAHSVLTVDLQDVDGHPTRAALDRVMAFFDQRLNADSA